MHSIMFRFIEFYTAQNFDSYCQTHHFYSGKLHELFLCGRKLIKINIFGMHVVPAVDCGIPSVPNANLGSLNGTQFENTVKVSCKTGYTANGKSNIIKCLSSSTWSEFKCEGTSDLPFVFKWPLHVHGSNLVIFYYHRTKRTHARTRAHTHAHTDRLDWVLEFGTWWLVSSRYIFPCMTSWFL